MQLSIIVCDSACVSVLLIYLCALKPSCSTGVFSGGMDGRVVGRPRVAPGPKSRDEYPTDEPWTYDHRIGLQMQY